jgi:hypothetical protein
MFKVDVSVAQLDSFDKYGTISAASMILVKGVVAMPALVVTTDAPLVAGPPQGHWSLADWEALPADENRYEIINGVLYMTTAPSIASTSGS